VISPGSELRVVDRGVRAWRRISLRRGN
jgi:hypothetical protein